MTGQSPIARRELLRRAAGAAAFGCAALIRPATTVAASAAGKRLDIAGNQLLENGVPIRLLGVSVGDPVFVRAGRTLDDYRVIATAWNANVVRIVVHPCHWRSEPSRLMRRLAEDVAAARAAGLRVIIAWHAIGFPGGYTERPDPAWGLPRDAYESDEPTARAFWQETATTYGSDPGVLFELWNEPIYNNRLIRSTGENWPRLKKLWLRLIADIRARSENIVLASGDRFAHDLHGVARDLIDDPRTAYAWHCYPGFDKDLANRWSVSLDGLAALKPVVVTEWGFAREDVVAVRGTPADFGDPFVTKVLEPLRLHSTAWVWSPNAGPQMIDRDGQPTEFGRFVKAYLATAWRPT